MLCADPNLVLAARDGVDHFLMKQRRLERLSPAVLHDVQATSGGSEPCAILTVYIDWPSVDWPTVLRVRARSGQSVGHKYAVPDALQAPSTSSPEIPLAILKQRVDAPASKVGLIGERNAKGVDAKKTSRCSGPHVAIVVSQKSEHLDGSQSWWQVNPAELSAIPSI